MNLPCLSTNNFELTKVSMLEHPPVGRCDWVSAVSDSLYCTAIFTPVTLLSITARALVSRKDDILQSSLHFSMEENFFTCLQILH